MTARQALCASTLTQCPAMCATAARTATPHSHTSHAHHNHTYAHPGQLHTQNHGPEGQVPRCGAGPHAVVPWAYSSCRKRTAHRPLCCGATDIRAPPGDAMFTPSTESWSHSSATPHQPCEPLPSTGCAVSTCPGFSPRSTREIQYSGNGPPQGPAPGSRAAVLSPTINDATTHGVAAPRVWALHGEMPTSPVIFKL